jgi:hypothetical protein
VSTLIKNSSVCQPTSLLDHFPPERRSLIANQFFTAYRSGAETVDAILLAVKADVLRRILTEEGDRLETQQLLLSILERGGATDYAKQIVDRERLSPEEKLRLKNERSDHYRRESMKAKPATAPQLQVLRTLGCKTKPANRLEASQLIEAHK